jgi:hypothetical protein
MSLRFRRNFRLKELSVPKEGTRDFNFNRGFFEPAYTNIRNKQLNNAIIEDVVLGEDKRSMRKNFS